LPTEAEWEYACRAKSTAALYNGKQLLYATGADANVEPLAWYKRTRQSQVLSPLCRPFFSEVGVASEQFHIQDSHLLDDGK